VKRKTIFLITSIIIIGFLIWEMNLRVVGMDLAPLKQFAINTTPCQKEFETVEKDGSIEICIAPPQPPDTVIKILNRSVINDNYKKYVLLIFLKLYYQQVLMYNQSFDVRLSPFFLHRHKDESALTRAFCEITGKNFLERKLGPEFLPAYEAIIFLDKNPHLKKDMYIKGQLAMIDSLQSSRYPIDSLDIQ
jgi:hypothetical protein